MTAPIPAAGPLDPEVLTRMDAWWHASLYLCAGMLYLRDNPLLKEPLKIEQIKKRLLGHWGSDPGQTLIWTHLNRLIQSRNLDVMFVSGPGHGAPSVLSQAWLEGTYGEVYPDKGQGEDGLRRFFRQFSFPGGIGSHCTPETPGSLHEGGELGYSLSHAFGVAFDNPDLIVACMVGDGEAETGPLATAWHGTKFLNPARDGAVLPILHLNGYKIANPTLLARISHDSSKTSCAATATSRISSKATSRRRCIRRWQPRWRRRWTGSARSSTRPARRVCGPAAVADDRAANAQGLDRPEGGGRPQGRRFWRAHQIPLDPHRDPAHLRQLEAWLKRYEPERLFAADGRLDPGAGELAPAGAGA